MVEVLQEALWYFEEQNEFLKLNKLNPYGGEVLFQQLQTKVAAEIIRLLRESIKGNSSPTPVNPQLLTDIRKIIKKEEPDEQQTAFPIGLPVQKPNPPPPVQRKIPKPPQLPQVAQLYPIIQVKWPDAALHKRYKCGFCHAKFVTKWDFNRHMKVHKNAKHKPIKPRMQRELQPLDQNSAGSNPTPVPPTKPSNTGEKCATNNKGSGPQTVIIKPKNFACLHCLKRFATMKSLETHMRIHNGTAFSCEYCGQVLASENRLKRHVLLHKVVRPFKCDVCKRSFQKESTLKKHIMQLHKNKKSLACKSCGNQFRSRSQLQYHELYTHRKEKPFKCTQCTASYNCRNNLLYHLKRHPNVKPYHCQFCPAKFTSEAELQTFHLQEHGRNEAFQCDKCTASYRQQSTLQNHQKWHKSENENTNVLNQTC